MQFIKKDTVIFQEAPLIAGGPQWLQKEASFMVLPEEKKRAYMSLHRDTLLKDLQRQQL